MKNCICEHEYEAHLWNINENPEGSPEMEDLGCKECGFWPQDGGSFITDCINYMEKEKV